MPFYLSRTHDSRLRTYTGRPRAPQPVTHALRHHLGRPLWGWAGARTRPRVWLLRSYKSVSHTARPRLVGVPAPRMAHAGWRVQTQRGGKGARVHVQRCSGGLARPSERGRGAGRGEGEGKLHPYGMYARPRAHTVLGALFSVQCQLSVFSSAPASRCLALRAHATPQSLPRACSMHRQKYSICEVKQLRGPDDLVYTC